MENEQIYSYKYNLILLAAAKLLSGFAGYIYDIGIVIYLFGETQSVAVIGGFFISQLLPAFIILLSGGIIDKFNKKNLIICSNLAKVVIFLFLMMNRNLYAIYIATFFFNFLLEFEGNTYSSLMTNIFPKEKILRAASVINLLDSISMITAPVCASIIAVFFQFNANLILDIALFAITAVLYLFIKIYQRQDCTEERIVGIKKGYFGIVKDKKILATVIFRNIFMLCIGITAPLEISMIETTLGMPSSYYGIGNTVEGIGMLIASGCVFGIIKKMKSDHIIMFGLFSAAFSYLVIGVSGNIWIYFIGAALVGITSTFCPLGFKTEIQVNSDPSIIGRTFTTARFTVLLSRIAGSFVVGAVLGRFGIRYVYLGTAAVLMVAAAVYARRIGKEYA